MVAQNLLYFIIIPGVLTLDGLVSREPEGRQAMQAGIHERAYQANRFPLTWI